MKRSATHAIDLKERELRDRLQQLHAAVRQLRELIEEYEQKPSNFMWRAIVAAVKRLESTLSNELTKGTHG